MKSTAESDAAGCSGDECQSEKEEKLEFWEKREWKCEAREENEEGVATRMRGCEDKKE